MSKSQPPKKNNQGMVFMGPNSDREMRLEQIIKAQNAIWSEETEAKYMEQVRAKAAAKVRSMLVEVHKRAEAIMSHAQQEADSRLQNANSIIENAQIATAKAQEKFKSAYTDATRLAQTEMQAQLASQQKSLGESTAVVLLSIHEQLDSIYDAWREDLHELLLEAIQVGTAWVADSQREQILTSMLDECVRKLVERKNYVVRVNPEDGALVTQVLENSKEKSWTMEVSKELEPGSLEVENLQAFVKNSSKERKDFVQGILDNLVLPKGEESEKAKKDVTDVLANEMKENPILAQVTASSTEGESANGVDVSQDGETATEENGFDSMQAYTPNEEEIALWDKTYEDQIQMSSAEDASSKREKLNSMAQAYPGANALQNPTLPQEYRDDYMEEMGEAEQVQTQVLDSESLAESEEKNTVQNFEDGQENEETGSPVESDLLSNQGVDDKHEEQDTPQDFSEALADASREISNEIGPTNLNEPKEQDTFSEEAEASNFDPMAELQEKAELTKIQEEMDFNQDSLNDAGISQEAVGEMPSDVITDDVSNDAFSDAFADAPNDASNDASDNAYNDTFGAQAEPQASSDTDSDVSDAENPVFTSSEETSEEEISAQNTPEELSFEATNDDSVDFKESEEAIQETALANEGAEAIQEEPSSHDSELIQTAKVAEADQSSQSIDVPQSSAEDLTEAESHAQDMAGSLVDEYLDDFTPDLSEIAMENSSELAEEATENITDKLETENDEAQTDVTKKGTSTNEQSKSSATELQDIFSESEELPQELADDLLAEMGFGDK